MKELVKANIIRQEKGVCEEDLLELVFDDKSKEYVPIGEFMRFINTKREKSNWNELKEGLYSVFDFDRGVFNENYLECVQDTLDKMKELENCNNGKNN